MNDQEDVLTFLKSPGAFGEDAGGNFQTIVVDIFASRPAGLERSEP